MNEGNLGLAKTKSGLTILCFSNNVLLVLDDGGDERIAEEFGSATPLGIILCPIHRQWLYEELKKEFEPCSTP